MNGHKKLADQSEKSTKKQPIEFDIVVTNMRYAETQRAAHMDYDKKMKNKKINTQ